MTKPEKKQWLSKALESDIPFQQNNDYEPHFTITQIEAYDDNIMDCRGGLSGIDKKSRHIILPIDLYEEFKKITEGVEFNVAVTVAIEMMITQAKENKIKFVVKRNDK